MSEEVMMESLPWESDGFEEFESDEAIAEADDSGEDIGEARRLRRRRSRYVPGRGVRGIVLRGQDGRPRNLPFPTKLATAEETNRGLARQEIGRRELDARLERLEARFRVQQKKDSSVSGIVTLAIGGGLTAFGAINAAKKPVRSTLEAWAKDGSTRMAALASVTQLTTSGAKLAINGRYHRSGFGIAADIFSAAQLAAFALGSLRTADVLQEVPDTAAPGAANPFSSGTRVFDRKTNKIHVVVETNLGKYFMSA